MNNTDLRHKLPLVVTFASIAILGTAFASQYWGGLQPCDLCWQQRYPYMATIVIGLAACIAQRQNPAGPVWKILLVTAGVSFAVGAGIAGYHAGVEWQWWTGPQSCTSTVSGNQDLDKLMQTILQTDVIRCDTPAWTLFGLSMAGYNFLASSLLMLLSFSVIPLFRK